MSKLALLPLQLLVSALVLGTEASRCSQAYSSCLADWFEPWTYRGLNGPNNWGWINKTCREGKEQSPIAIITEDAVEDENLAPLALIGYQVPLTNASIENNGHTIEVKPHDGVERTIFVEGDNYTLHQFHFHWGREKCNGSEHTLDGRQYTMEMHLVHMSGPKIAVVGIFFEEQDKENEELRPIVEQLSNLTYKGSQTEMTTPLNLNNLLPANPTPFFGYNGSLTTPGCAEGVKWSVVSQAMSVGKGQMDKFRQLSSAVQGIPASNCPLAGNYRPVQNLNGRKVYRTRLHISR